MKLPAEAVATLHEALLDAFNTSTLEQFLRFRLNVRLEDLSLSKNLQDIITDLIEWAERTDQVKGLVRKAQAANETNKALSNFIENHRHLGLIRTQELERLATSLAALGYTDVRLRDEATQFGLWPANASTGEPSDLLKILKQVADAPTLSTERNHVCKLVREIQGKLGGKHEDLQAWLTEYDRVQIATPRTFSGEHPAAMVSRSRPRWHIPAFVATGIGLGILFAVIYSFIVNSHEPFAQCIAAGKAYRRPYVIQSATMHVTASHIGAQRRDSTRTVYTVIPLQNFASDSEWFKEIYATNYGTLLRWYGSEPEVEIKFSKSSNQNTYYSVQFEGKINSPRTIVTGAEVFLAYPLAADRKYAEILEHIPSNEDAWVYPNTEDVICELTIVLESPDWTFRAKPHGALRVTRGQFNHENVEDHQGDALHVGSLTKRWTLLVPNETVAIHYAFAEK